METPPDKSCMTLCKKHVIEAKQNYDTLKAKTRVRGAKCMNPNCTHVKVIKPAFRSLDKVCDCIGLPKSSWYALNATMTYQNAKRLFM